MPAKKSSKKKSSTKKETKIVRDAVGYLSYNGYDNDFEFQPIETRRTPPLSPEEEAKRLARRKALTLRAFQTAYDNHHRRRKAS